MRMLLVVLSLYAAYVLLVGSVVFASTKKNRISLSALAGLMPLAFVFSVVRAFADLITGRMDSAEPCPARLEQAELLVEKTRASLFGGPVGRPSLAPMLEARYRMYLGQSTSSLKNMITMIHRNAA